MEHKTTLKLTSRSGLGEQLLPTTGNASDVARLQALLEARAPGGQPAKGYKRNVATIRSRIAQLQALDIPRTV